MCVCLRVSILVFCIIFSSFSGFSKSSKAETVRFLVGKEVGVRGRFGAERLKAYLGQNHFRIKEVSRLSGRYKSISIFQVDSLTEKEQFSIKSIDGEQLQICGSDDSGVLYGCMQLMEELQKNNFSFAGLHIKDQPEMVLRGTCIGVQKPEYLPGREVYEYPYTPESFPWFYDKELWVSYLDMMLENRYNSLYLWNGHPFASLVKVKEYPEALEVDEATFKKNEEIYRFITQEANKRGIWVIQMFYNIIIPKPLADKHGWKTQDRNRPTIPLIADYTRKSIAAFVEKYPNVGLLVTLGEAMEGVGQQDIDWFTNTIIPGVKDGLKALNIKTEPPVVLRAHDTDAPAVMEAALPLYKNLYTMAKYNGEALTTYTPRGKWADLHRTLSAIGTVHVENVHILANLEPFRYASADFIQKSVQAMHKVYHANGLHLYPESSYWDWPYTADKAGKRLLQINRDKLWYKAWARYAWKADRSREEEVDYWSGYIGDDFLTSKSDGRQILKALEEDGEIAPKLLRRYGITDGNRQTLTLGMLMTQLINPFRYGLFTLLYESEAPEGEMIIDYAEKEWKGEQHTGETPVQVAQEVVAHGRKAIEAIQAVAVSSINKNQDEFIRIRNDVYAYNLLANFYAEKVQAALHILRYKYSGEIADLEKAVPYMERSLEYYKDLAKLTNKTYLYANSMQTKQRKIPMRGVDKTFVHWNEMVPVFETELANFKNNIDSLKGVQKVKNVPVKPYRNAEIKLYDGSETVLLKNGQQIFSDESVTIKNIAPELKGLKALKLNAANQVKYGTEINFYADKPVTVLVGFFQTKEKSAVFSPTPELEIDASANNFGQAESKISNGLILGDWPVVNVHAYNFPAGKNELTLAKGKVLILGFVDAGQKIRIYDAGLSGGGRDIDWLFGEYAPTDVKL